MRTLHSVLKHGGLYWDRDLTSPADCEGRFRRVQQAVAASGDEAWLVFGDIERAGNITYVSHFLPRVRSALAFVPRGGAPVLLANIGLRDVPAAKTITWIEDVRPFGRLPKEVIGLIEERGLTTARIGTCGFDESLPITEWDAIEAGLPQVRWQGRDVEMSGLRGVKGAAEIGVMRRAAEIADAAFSRAPEALRPGTSLRQAIAAIDRHARASGAEDTRYLIAHGPGSDGALRPVDDRPLAAGDWLTIYMTVQFQRYWAETVRCFSLGPAPQGLRSLHERAVQAVAAMSGAARADHPAADVATAAKRVIGDEVLVRSAKLYGFGHGIGLDAEETPRICDTNDTALAENGTLALRAILHDGKLCTGASGMVVIGTGSGAQIDRAAPLIEIRV